MITLAKHRSGQRVKQNFLNAINGVLVLRSYSKALKAQWSPIFPALQTSGGGGGSGRGRGDGFTCTCHFHKCSGSCSPPLPRPNLALGHRLGVDIFSKLGAA